MLLIFIGETNKIFIRDANEFTLTTPYDSVIRNKAT